MKYIVDHIPLNTPNKRRSGIGMNPTTITIHNTGNPRSTARNERGWLTNPTNQRQASFHIVVDAQEAIECIPLHEVAWHAGDGRGDGNMKSISIEICESGDYTKNIEHAVQLVAKMLKERGWGIERLRRHWDWSKKVCPRLMYGEGTWNAWESFKVQVRNRLNEQIGQAAQEQAVSSWAVEAWQWAIREKLTDGNTPRDPLSREQLMTILYRYHKKYGSN
ncbi:peptidoglycan recognition protein family protein [Caldalkalibacillus mannanilyticus]|uniref:peptidoglycan recognition protein family protein n=1 Tax=Caldalkalibacillus mannanilyticus TaxID=1418 RepID=UPI00046987B6|nr:N-acetylmuramoyl-L-alanine amidase [Caldalkalibacillus mannanilyticus]